MVMLAQCLLSIVSLLFIHCTTCNTVPESACEVYTKPGNITLAGIFPFRESLEEYCNPGTTFWGLQLSEAMIWAIEEVNNHQDLLPDVTIGYEIRDDCRTEDSALWAALSFFTDTCHMYQNKTDANIVGIIGGAFSSTSIFISKVANIYKIPFISFSATSDELSDKKRFPYFLRTLPPNRYQVGVFIDIILKYNWRYIALIYSADTYGIHGATQIKSLAEEYDICLALSAAVQPHAPQNEIDEVIEKLKRVPKAKVVIVFALDDIADGLLSTIYRRNLNWNITWIASEGWGYETETLEWASVLVGSFFIKISRPHAPDFEQYFSSLDPTFRAGSPWYNEYWEDWQITQECRDITLCPYDTAASGGPVIDAVNAFAHALHNMFSECRDGKCLSPEQITGASLLQYLHRVRFNASAGPMQFDEFGDTLGTFIIQNLQRDDIGFKVVNAGYWDPRDIDSPLVIYSEKIRFNDNSKSPPYSLCGDRCQVDFGLTENTL
ncbi:metabotropic glutamate receptor 3-like [Amphiura filiformis]|uniref:metabotropic glutamate receptor 3-like n=1 Tax=Amphiura filiformis TaxID=82378 RepID=UPI003B225110